MSEDRTIQKLSKLRERMVRLQISRRGIRSRHVIEAMKKIPRHLFVPTSKIGQAYEDKPIEIGYSQTISQPYVVASMTEELALTNDSKVLEIGTGSGYQTAILAEICKEVFTIELVQELYLQASKLFKELGYSNITTRLTDGNMGWPDMAPFDGIIVTAAANSLPQALADQLAIDGKMVIPLKTEDSSEQELFLFHKTARGLLKTCLYEVRFVPLVNS